MDEQHPKRPVPQSPATDATGRWALAYTEPALWCWHGYIETGGFCAMLWPPSIISCGFILLSMLRAGEKKWLSKHRLDQLALPLR